MPAIFRFCNNFAKAQIPKTLAFPILSVYKSIKTSHAKAESGIVRNNVSTQFG